MASVLFTKLLACSVGMGLFITLMVLTAPQWSRLFAAKWLVYLWALLAGCLCLPLVPRIPAVEAFFNRYPWIMAGWLIIAAAVLAFAFWRQSRFRKDAVEWSKEPEIGAFTVKAARLAEELHMKHSPSVRISAKVCCPTILGLGEPILLLPHEKYTDTEFDIILRHEFYHYLHEHITYKVFLTIVAALHWFNPAAWLLRQKACVDLEAACDDALLTDASEKTRHQYSDTILSVMQSPSGYSSPFSTHTYGSPIATGRRLVRLLSAPPKTGGATLLCLAVILTILSGTAVATATAKLEAPSASALSPSRNTVSLDGTSSTPSAPPLPTSSADEPSASQVSSDTESDVISSSLAEASSAAESEENSSSSEENDEALSSSEESNEASSSSEESEDVSSSSEENASSNTENTNGEATEGLEGFIVPGEKTAGFPSDDVFIAVINRVIDAYNNDTADTSMSDPDAPVLMPMPASVTSIPRVTTSEEFQALPRTSNGYSIVIPIAGTGIQMQIWADDNGSNNVYQFDIAAVNFVRG